MSIEDVSWILGSLIDNSKVRIIVQGPALCGKTTTILKCLKSSKKKFAYLDVLTLFGNPTIQTVNILEKYIRNGFLLFIDNIEVIFPCSDPDFLLVERFLSKKPNLIAACRDISEINPFIIQYFDDCLKMDQPRSETVQKTDNVSFDDIGGSSLAKELVLMMASWCVVHNNEIQKWGLKPPSGAMLYGPPGTGKTLLAKAAATACHCKFFSISIPDLLRCEVGESEKRLTKVFECARADSPSIVFIDEIQALFGRRSERKSDSNRLVVQLFTQLDASAGKLVFCLAATNAIEAVDPALLQPGRFEEIIEIGLPNQKEREEIIRVALKTIQHEDNIEMMVENFSSITDGYSASDIVGICQKAAISSLIKGDPVLKYSDIIEEVKRETLKRLKK